MEMPREFSGMGQILNASAKTQHDVAVIQNLQVQNRLSQRNNKLQFLWFYWFVFLGFSPPLVLKLKNTIKDSVKTHLLPLEENEVEKPTG